MLEYNTRSFYVHGESFFADSLGFRDDGWIQGTARNISVVSSRCVITDEAAVSRKQI